MASLFYCVPFGGVSFASFTSDFRIYDFALLFFIWKNRIYLRRRIGFVFVERTVFSTFLLWVMFFWGVLVAISFRGFEGAPVLIVRFIRMSFYLSFYIILIRKYVYLIDVHFILFLFFVFSLLNAVVAFFQSLGSLPIFWPKVWRDNYWGTDWPTAFLSVHHLQFGVVMVFLIAISFYYFMQSRKLFLRFVYVLIGFLAFYLSFMNESRTGIIFSLFLTALFSFFSIGRSFFSVFVLYSFLIFFFLFVYGSNYFSLASEKYNKVVVSQIEGKGSLSQAREKIYLKGFPTIVSSSPWVLLLGAGFQNYVMVSHYGNAAHNNYLQYLVELGILGLFCFLYFLKIVYGNIKRISFLLSIMPNRQVWRLQVFLKSVFWTVLGIMLVNEVIYPQYSLFTLPVQTLVLFALPIILHKAIVFEIYFSEVGHNDLPILFSGR